MPIKLYRALIVLGGVMFSAPALAQQPGNWGGGWGQHMMWNGWLGGPYMILVWLLVAGLIIWGLAKIFGGGSRNGSGQNLDRNGQALDALELLKRRYASGEIGREEFLAMKKDLQA